MESIPSQASYLRESLRLFWKLKITLSIPTVTEKCKEPDYQYYRSLPLFNNPIFKLRTNLKPEWRRLGFDIIGSLFNPQIGAPLTRNELKANIKREDARDTQATGAPLLTRKSIYAHAAKMIRWVAPIHATLKHSLTQTHLPYESGETVQYTDDPNVQQYAVFDKPDLYELRFDNGGFSVKLPSPHDTRVLDGISTVPLMASVRSHCGAASPARFAQSWALHVPPSLTMNGGPHHTILTPSACQN